MIGVLLAAGLSTRMRPLTDKLPKPMLPVAGRPMLAYVVEKFRRAGITDLIITVHYHPEVIREYFGTGERFGVRIRYSHEPELMNTAGSLKRLERELTDPFVVAGTNALLPRVDLQALIAFHRRKKAMGTIALTRLTDPARLRLYGQALCGRYGRILDFVEKPKEMLSGLVHTTYQCYSPAALAYVQPATPASIPEVLIPNLLAAGERLFGQVVDGPLHSISTPEQYAETNEIFTREMSSGQVFAGGSGNEC